ncbi:Uncharacterised protein [Vibrio cholerae]|nr:Uncharacterised protein [Vibrio cholerae]
MIIESSLADLVDFLGSKPSSTNSARLSLAWIASRSFIAGYSPNLMRCILPLMLAR